ncbi:MAG: phosphatidate cytidylyltransferase [bacterium]
MKIRIISSIVILSIVLPLIFIGGLYFYIGLAILSMFAYKEVVQLPVFNNVPIGIKIFGSLAYLSVVLGGLFGSDINCIGYYNLILLLIFFLVPTLFCSNKEYNMKDALYLIGLLLFVGTGFSAFIYARESLEVFLFLICIPVVSDVFAMLTGMLIGKTKLCPTISPKKTVEGSAGGLITSVIIALVVYHYYIGIITLSTVLMVICLSIFSQIGDLIFSKIKRENDIKDFSNLIPGHGGVLDRIDSTMLVCIIYLFLSSII